MTLTQIVTAALEQMDRTTDAQMQETWKDKFVQLANEGLIDLAVALRLRRTDPLVANDDGQIDISELPYECLRIVRVTQNARPVAFSRGGASYLFRIGATGRVDVEYRYLPRQLSSDTDEPGIPERLHGLLVTYICAREYTTNDEVTQTRAKHFYDLYHAGKTRAEKAYGEPEAYALYNKY